MLKSWFFFIVFAALSASVPVTTAFAAVSLQITPLAAAPASPAGAGLDRTAELGRSGSTPGFVPPGLGGTPLPYGGIQAFQTNAADATSRANWGLLGLLGLCGLAGRRGRNES
ncbi:MULTISPECIES: WGxxGxxG family protein [Paenibacillus]|uniref:Uncharacterized protein n=2 Tax=Paenibacillus validus TaxID=44253 RepID=A0A7X2Z8R8_9BACL|nr:MULTISPECIES: WGxxGxxG family protein [Paenibacillus]MED4605790.1 WGxxGxxG-CTERM domain-containing protein [Paenibacillus validus]MUG70425.1 hypothetical protein [Paenibacillus validus]